MILTVTMNPAIDISYSVKKLNNNQANRVEKEMKTAGGKGLNVARVVSLLGEKVETTGLIGGILGEFIEKKLKKEKINNKFLRTFEESRICIAILHDDFQQTEILENGPKYNQDIEEQFLSYFDKLLSKQKYDVVTVSGSLPQGISTNVYSKMMAIAKARKVIPLLDTSGLVLKESISIKENLPYLIKPNLEELAELVNKPEINDDKEIISALKESIFSNLPVVIVTLGGRGAIAKSGESIYKITIPKIDAINPVGSGDATIAGFAVGLTRDESFENWLKLGMASGMLNALEEKTGFINKLNIEKLMSEIEVNKLI